MAKETFYFSHDYGARNDPKLIKLLMKLGQEGKGIYWDLVEMLYEQNGYLDLHECESIAFALRTDCDKLISVLKDFDLFVNDGNYFYSQSVLNRLAQRSEKSHQATLAAYQRWNKKVKPSNIQEVTINEGCERNADAVQTESERNADGMLVKESKVKESKVKESKVKESKVNKHPYRDNVFLSEEEYLKLRENYLEPELNDMLDNLSNYQHSKGTKYKSHYHTILNWFKKENKTTQKNGKQTFTNEQQRIRAEREEFSNAFRAMLNRE